MALEGMLLALAIFVLRVINYAVGTVRMVTIARNQRLIAATLASFEALIFAVVIANIVNDLENLLNLIAYCAGAAVGSWVGMVLEGRLIKGFVIINVFDTINGQNVAAALREAGYGVTEITGQGRDGQVVTLRSVVDKREARRVAKIVQAKSPEAFMVIEEVRGLQRGWFGVGRGKTV